MAIKADFPIQIIKDYLTECQKIVIEYTYQALAYFAEECVNRIRDRSAEDSWKDHTGNLRSSIGYIITQDGHVVTNGGFKPTNAENGNGGIGQTKGKQYAESLVSQLSYYPIALAVVAGMEYAIYVEARDNKDVLASTELWAREEWKRREPTLKAAIEKACQKLAQQMKIA